ncbi:MAG: GIY-YIG nuclease family protein, partial [Acidiferrobacteraceae bacterium]
MPGKTNIAWTVYLLQCRGGSLYTGITTDLTRRYAEHLRGAGAKYTRAHPPRRIVCSAQFPDQASASKMEWYIKSLPRRGKVAALRAQAESHTSLVEANHPCL